ncbi:MAG: penicillin acylase family protein [Planctomycetaceae bacterium]
MKNSPVNLRRRWLRYAASILFGLLVIACCAAVFVVPRLNRYQIDGEIRVPGLHGELTVVRDGKGMPYIYADSLHDVIFGQGFVTAQDRLFQIHLMRLKAAGRLTELAGEAARDLDIMTRTIGIRRLATRHAEILDQDSLAVFQAYADGINAFIDQCADDIPLEFSLSGLQTERWEVEDSLSLLYLMSWDTSANLNHEIVSQLLVDKLGTTKAAELMPLNVNPDAPSDAMARRSQQNRSLTLHPDRSLQLRSDEKVLAFLKGGPLTVGSNNWATAPKLSAGDHAMLAGDPHLDPRMLPGIMYAVGYLTPQMRAVGAGVPGIPGFIIGRNQFIATAVTNNYGDVQDLYVESLDAEEKDHYREAGRSVPFRVEKETLKIRDDSRPDGFRREEIEIRFSSRGPVVSDLLPGLANDKVLTLRWAAAESMQPRTGLTDLMTATSIDAVDAAIASVNFIVLNFVFADAEGNIGWRASGQLPLRKSGTGTMPFPVDAQKPWEDNWEGWIAFDEMPHARNPDQGWLGTANHSTVPPDYPHYYSNYAAPSFRYRRMKQRIAEYEHGLTVDNHWSIQRDTRNLMAEAVAPVLIAALKEGAETRPLAGILSAWNFHDTVDQPGPTVFQLVYGEFAKAVYTDELGEELTLTMLSNWYFWQERFLQTVLAGDSSWFDDLSTIDVQETRGDMIRRAGRAALARWRPQLGADPQSWLWGHVHTVQFVNPIRRSGFGSEQLGTAALPVDGSGETLYRGGYSFNDSCAVTFAAAVRMVVDFGDSEKVRAVMAGGSTGRTFHAHLKDQIDPYLSGEPKHWWFSDKAIEEHAKSRLRLVPQ